MSLVLKPREIEEAEQFRSRVEHIRATSLFEDVRDRSEVVENLARKLRTERFHQGQNIIR